MSDRKSQYYPVILELGSRFVRAGFAGDAAPVAVHLTNDPVFLSKVQAHTEGEQNCNCDNAATFLRPDAVAAYHKRNLERKSWLWNYSITEDQVVTEALLDEIVAHIFSTDLLIATKRCKVIVPYPIEWPKHIQETVCKVLIRKNLARSVLFLPDVALAAISAGTSNALVVHLGWHSVSVTPVFDNRVLSSLQRSTVTCSGMHVHYQVFQDLQTHSPDLVDSIPESQLFDTIEAVVYEALCVQPGREPVAGYKLSNGMEISGTVRTAWAQQCLESCVEHDVNEIPVSTLISQVINSLPIDIRDSLAHRVVFSGELSKIPGLRATILRQLRNKSMKVSGVAAVVSLGAWAGASLFCSTKLMVSANLFKQHEISRDKYLRGEKLMDWVDTLYLTDSAST